MSRAHRLDDIARPPAMPGQPRMHLIFPADACSVRLALSRALATLRAQPIDADLRGLVELVLAEVLNNIVEHAYGPDASGMIEVEMRPTAAGLRFLVHDDGAAMPGERMPPGTPRSLDVEPEDLPEGGFGWFMIRELTADLHYQRDGERNALSFLVPFDAPRAPGAA